MWHLIHQGLMSLITVFLVKILKSIVVLHIATETVFYSNVLYLKL